MLDHRSLGVRTARIDRETMVAYNDGIDKVLMLRDGNMQGHYLD